MNVYCLYFPNGKRYIGVEKRTGRRIADHARCSSIRKEKTKNQSPQIVHLAIHHYGWENVHWRYLATNCPNEDGWALERYFIRLFATMDREQGYNVQAGGKSNHEGKTNTQESVNRGLATKKRNGTLRPEHFFTPEARAKVAAIKAERRKQGFKRKSVSAESLAKRRYCRNSGTFKPGLIPWNKGKPHPSKMKGRIRLPAGPNGEMWFFRPEQFI